MSVLQPGDREDQNPVTPEEYQSVRDGAGTPDQVKRVRAALRDKQSPLWKWLGETAPWAKMAIERKYATPVIHPDSLTPIPQQNFYRVIEYLRSKREAGAMSEHEVNLVLKSLHAEHLNDPSPEPSQYAMSVARMIRAIIKLHPELKDEARALPISSKR